MKKLMIICLTAGLFLAAASFVTAAPVDYFLWNGSGGTWADADKTNLETADDLMCWAASASNVLEWTGLGNVLGFTTTDQMFGYFHDHWTDRGGLMEYGWDWWFSGTYHGPVVGGLELDLTGSSDPVWSQPDVVGGNFYPSLNFNDYFHETWGSSATLSAVDQYLQSGYGTTLAVYSPVRGHSLTVWGFRYDVDDPAYYTGVYVTDSDDIVNVLRYYEVENVGGNWYLQGLYGTNNTWQIRGVQAMSQIPEPTTITLFSLGVLSLIRRKK
ncbi:MAG: PEP-CTERM sorting domain-containing protein [Phycisphaerae bacterium]|jgi:hypothetical protein